MMANLKRYLPLWNKWDTLTPVSYNPNNALYEAHGETQPNSAIISHVEYTAAAEEDDIKASMMEYCNLAQNAGLTPFEKCTLFERSDGGQDAFLYMPRLKKFDINSKLSPKQMHKFAQQIGAALQNLHDSGIVHCNLNPSNIFSGPDGKWLLGGLMYDVAQYRNIVPQADFKYSIFTAPEVTNGEPFSILSDIFSYGMLLYCLYNNGNPPDLSNIAAPENADENFAHVILKACALNSAERWQSVKEIRDALRVQREQTINEPEKQAANGTEKQSAQDAANQPAKQPAKQAANNAANQPAKQTAKQAANNAANQPAKQPEKQAANNAANQPAKQPEKQTANNAANQPAKQTAKQAANNAANQPAKQTAKQAANNAANQPAKQTAKQAANQAETLYPELASYLSIFDPDNSTLYPPPTQADDANPIVLATPDDSPAAPVTDMRSIINRKKPIFQAAVLILIAAAIVTTFIIIGINSIPGLEPSQAPVVQNMRNYHEDAIVGFWQLRSFKPV